MRAVSSVLLSLVVVCPSSAQRLPPPLPGAVSASRSTPAERSASATASQPQSKSPAGTIAGTVLGGAAGTVVLTGAYFAACYEGCEENAAGLIAAGLVGQALIASFGAHLGNRLAGNFALDWAVAGGIALGAGALTAAASDNAGGAILVSAAIVQVVALVLVERAKGAQKARAAPSEAR